MHRRGLIFALSFCVACGSTAEPSANADIAGTYDLRIYNGSSLPFSSAPGIVVTGGTFEIAGDMAFRRTVASIGGRTETSVDTLTFGRAGLNREQLFLVYKSSGSALGMALLSTNTITLNPGATQSVYNKR